MAIEFRRLDDVCRVYPYLYIKYYSLESTELCTELLYVLYCIGGLKVHGSDKTTYSVYGKDLLKRDPDYPWTIDAKGYPTLPVAYPGFESALFGAFPTPRPTISN